MQYIVKAIQFSDSIKIKAVREFFSDFDNSGDSDEVFIDLNGERFLYIFKYGVVCFFNMQTNQQQSFLKQLKPFSPSIVKENLFETQNLEIGKTYAVSQEAITINSFDKDTIRLIMFNVSQSVALDYYYSISEKLLEDTRIYTDQLEHIGKLGLSGKRLKKYIGRVLNIRNRVVENLYIFDAPDVTWENEQLNQLDQDLKKHFDLKDRYRAVHEQVDIVKENLELFKDLMFHSESSKLEWIIIVLILVEVVDLFVLKF